MVFNLKNYKKEYQKNYRKKYKEKLKRIQTDYKKQHRINSLKYYYKNKNKVIKKTIECNKRRRKLNSSFNIKNRLRSLVFRALNHYSMTGKIYSSGKYGVNYSLIIKYLKPFPEDLSKYNIHHIKPLHTFDLNDSKQIKQAFAPENHMWLTIPEHREVHNGVIKFVKC